MLGTKLGSSERLEDAVNCWTISPASRTLDFCNSLLAVSSFLFSAYILLSSTWPSKNMSYHAIFILKLYFPAPSEKIQWLTMTYKLYYFNLSLPWKSDPLMIIYVCAHHLPGHFPVIVTVLLTLDSCFHALEIRTVFPGITQQMRPWCYLPCSEHFTSCD